MIYKLMLGENCLGTYKSSRSALFEYTLVDLVVKSAKVDCSSVGLCLILVKE